MPTSACHSLAIEHPEVNNQDVRKVFRILLALFLVLLAVGILTNITATTEWNTQTQAKANKDQAELEKKEAALILDPGIKFTYGSKTSWSSCKPIPYLLSKGTTKSQAELVASAIKTIGKSRGLSFVFVGYSKKIAHSNWGEGFTNGEYRPVLISFVKPSQTDLLGKNNGGGAVVNRFSDNLNLYVSGSVAFNVNTYNSLGDGFSEGKSKGNLLMHEFGHLIGLEHVKKTSALMYPSINDRTENGLNNNELSSLRSYSATCKD